MSRDQELIYMEAERLVESRAFKEAEKALRETLYARWVDSNDPKEREELNAMAKSSDLFFKIMVAWGKKGKSIESALEEEWNRSALDSVT